MPKPKIKTKPNKRKRSAENEFTVVARRLECDEDKERFEAKLGKIVKIRLTRHHKDS